MRLDQDVARPTVKRSPQDAVAYARLRLEDLNESVGAQHPDYASGLIQLALLMIMHGDPAEAEPLLRQALDIRRDTLGERHPDFATCLSSLAGLLWARGDLDGAEPLLRQALDIRCEVLGERHPKSIVSLNSLEQLLQAKAVWADTNPPGVRTPPTIDPPSFAPDSVPIAASVVTAARGKGPVPTAPLPDREIKVPVKPEPSSAALGRVELARAVGVYSAELAALGDRLTRAAKQLITDGVFPDERFDHDCIANRRRFHELRARALSLAEAAAVAPPDPQTLASTHDLVALLGRVEHAEADREHHGAARRAALAVLDRVAKLVTTDRAEFGPLQTCQAQARALSQEIGAPGPIGMIADAFQLADGSHPLAALLVLVEGDDGVSDEAWAHAHEAVEAQFGRALSVAAARGRMAFRS